MTTSRPQVPIRHCLDLEEGLHRLMGEHSLYLQILRRFRQDYHDAVPRMTEQLKRDDDYSVQCTAHSMKGSAGLIGAQIVHDLAVQVENTVAAGRDVSALLPPLQQAMQQLCSTIEELVSEESTPANIAPAPAPDPAALRELLDRLDYLLSEGDGEAIDLVEQSAAVLAAALGVPAYQAIAAAAHAFDFDAALDALRSEI